MNDILNKLISERTIKNNQMRDLHSEICKLNEIIRTEIIKEERVISNVLQKQLNEVIDIIHKENVMIKSIRGAETYHDKPEYVISDDCYNATIRLYDGNIVIDYSADNNDGCGKNLYEKAKTIITHLNYLIEKYRNEVEI